MHLGLQGEQLRQYLKKSKTMIETISNNVQGRSSTIGSLRGDESVDFTTRRVRPKFLGEAQQSRDESDLLDSQPSDIRSSIGYRVPWVPPAARVAGDLFELREKFDGVVLSVGEKDFEARLYPSASSGEIVEALFSRDDLNVLDRNSLAPGALFVLTIGYRTIGSSRRRESSFYLRRMPSLTEEHVSQAKARAVQFKNDVQWK
jgi:hypothetical protein